MKQFSMFLAPIQDTDAFTNSNSFAEGETLWLLNVNFLAIFEVECWIRIIIHKILATNIFIHSVRRIVINDNLCLIAVEFKLNLSHEMLMHFIKNECQIHEKIFLYWNLIDKEALNNF